MGTSQRIPHAPRESGQVILRNRLSAEPCWGPSSLFQLCTRLAEAHASIAKGSAVGGYFQQLLNQRKWCVATIFTAGCFGTASDSNALAMRC